MHGLIVLGLLAGAAAAGINVTQYSYYEVMENSGLLIGFHNDSETTFDIGMVEGDEVDGVMPGNVWLTSIGMGAFYNGTWHGAGYSAAGGRMFTIEPNRGIKNATYMSETCRSTMQPKVCGYMCTDDAACAAYTFIRNETHRCCYLYNETYSMGCVSLYR